MGDPKSAKAEYDRISNWLLDNSTLGHGLHEDFLVESSRWFHERIGRNGECLADCFCAARENHVALLFALPSLSPDAEAANDLFDFLHYLVSWIIQIPPGLLEKSTEPLILVVGHRGGSGEFGAQMMQRCGPSILFWQTFSSFRKALGQLNYAQLSNQICKTLVHELVGHQLAFCCSNGPIVTAAEVSQILSIAKIDFVKLSDGSTLSAADFVRAPDLLAAVRRTEYIQSARHTHRYFGNLAELIAYAVDGVPDNLPYDYAGILKVLKGDLLREAQPVNEAGSRTPIYRVHDLSVAPFRQQYCYLEGTEWTETEAICRNRQWLSLHECQLRFRASLAGSSALAKTVFLSPRKSLSISLPFDGMAVSIRGRDFVASAFGIHAFENDVFKRLPSHLKEPDFSLRSEKAQDESELLTLSNLGKDSFPVSFGRLDAASPARAENTAPNEDSNAGAGAG